MQKDLLQELLTEACVERGGAYLVPERDQATVLLATEGPLERIEGVTRLELRPGYLVMQVNAGEEVFMVDLTRVVGLKLRRTKREGAGFVV
jgi:hypothetical protein